MKTWRTCGGAGSDPDDIEKYVHQMCGASLTPENLERASSTEERLQTAANGYIRRLARLTESVRGDPVNAEELCMTIEALADGLEPYEETMGVVA